jgi:putative transposase
VVLPPKSPNLNSYAERFVKSIKTESLNKFIPMGEDFLRHIKEYLEHYHV